MSATHVLPEVVGLFNRVGLDFMVVGSFASTHHGLPRTTQDLDLVVELDEAALPTLLDAIDRERWYVPDDTARAAVADGGQFNLVDLETSWKVDVIVRRDRPFSRVEFGRRVRVVMDGVEVFVATPEDTILAKLEWALDGESERQLRDVGAVLTVSGSVIDDEYLDHWAKELGVVELLQEARRTI